MARIAEITVQQESFHYMISIRKTIDFMATYSAFAKETLTKTGALLTQNGLFPISGPVVCFHNTDLTALDVEMGWQVVTPIETASHDGITCLFPREQLRLLLTLALMKNKTLL